LLAAAAFRIDARSVGLGGVQMRLGFVCSFVFVSSLTLLGACSSDDSSSNNAASGGSSGAGTGGATTGGTSGAAGAATGGAAGGSACDTTAFADAALLDGEKLFGGVTLTSSTPIAEINANPASFEGKVVRVEGFIVTICQEQGCYVTLQSPDAEQLNLKVTDGVLDFRQHASLGQYAIGEGISQQAGEHGAQVFIQDHGAVLGKNICATYAGN
jgi:hypothetical protein